jgi:hypothetical protein
MQSHRKDSKHIFLAIVILIGLPNHFFLKILAAQTPQNVKQKQDKYNCCYASLLSSFT